MPCSPKKGSPKFVSPRSIQLEQMAHHTKPLLGRDEPLPNAPDRLPERSKHYHFPLRTNHTFSNTPGLRENCGPNRRRSHLVTNCLEFGFLQKRCSQCYCSHGYLRISKVPSIEVESMATTLLAPLSFALRVDQPSARPYCSTERRQKVHRPREGTCIVVRSFMMTPCSQVESWNWFDVWGCPSIMKLSRQEMLIGGK